MGVCPPAVKSCPLLLLVDNGREESEWKTKG